MITAKIAGITYRVLDRMLNSLAEDRFPGQPIIRKLSIRFLPYYWAAVEMRRGNLSGAAQMSSAKPQSRLYQRASQMLNLMREGVVYSAKRQKFEPFNGSILFLIHSAPSFDVNGYGIRSLQIIRTLVEGGYQVYPLTRIGYPTDLRTHRYSEPPLSSTYAGVKFHHFPAGLISIASPEQDYIAEYARSIVDLARSNTFSVVHSHSNFLNGIAGNLAAHELGLKSVYEMRGLWHWTRAAKQTSYASSEHYRYCEKMELEAARGADVVVAISSALRDWLVHRSIDRNKIVVIGNAADYSNVPPIQRRQAKVRGGVFTVGYVGAITAYEGLASLVDALDILLRKNLDIKLVVAGSGDYSAAFMEKVKALGVEKAVEFLGRIPPAEVEEVYARCDVCPLPRAKHPVTELVPPLKPFEIMMHRVPIIVSRLGPLLEIVKEEKTGLVCEADDPASLAAAIERLMHDPQLAETLARNAADWTRHEANWVNQFQNYEAIYAT